MDETQKKVLRLLFSRQEKRHLSVAALLVLSVPHGMEPNAAIDALKEAAVAWYDAEPKNAIACMANARIDLNIGDLDAHGAFDDIVFRAALSRRDVEFKELQFLSFDEGFAFDMPLFVPTQIEADKEQPPAGFIPNPAAYVSGLN